MVGFLVSFGFVLVLVLWVVLLLFGLGRWVFGVIIIAGGCLCLTVVTGVLLIR